MKVCRRMCWKQSREINLEENLSRRLKDFPFCRRMRSSWGKSAMGKENLDSTISRITVAPPHADRDLELFKKSLLGASSRLVLKGACPTGLLTRMTTERTHC